VEKNQFVGFLTITPLRLWQTVPRDFKRLCKWILSKKSVYLRLATVRACSVFLCHRAWLVAALY